MRWLSIHCSSTQNCGCWTIGSVFRDIGLLFLRNENSKQTANYLNKALQQQQQQNLIIKTSSKTFPR